MKIFITGATGFIGSNLAKYFFNENVREYQRFSTNIKKQLDEFHPDWIINCGAEIYDVENMWSANVELVKDILDWIKIHSHTKLIHMGSSSEYGSCDQPTKETDPIKATDMYGSTKGIATLLCVAYAKSFNLDAVVVRPYSPYGPGERDRRLFPKLWQSFKINLPMQLVQGVHDFVYIDDFVEAVDCIMKSKNRTFGDIVNIGSGAQTTNEEVFEVFKKVTGLNGSVTLLDKFCTPKMWQADINHIRDVYGWTPKTSLEKGVKQFLEIANYE